MEVLGSANGTMLTNNSNDSLLSGGATINLTGWFDDTDTVTRTTITHVTYGSLQCSVGKRSNAIMTDTDAHLGSESSDTP